jgi:hypothetical protein
LRTPPMSKERYASHLTLLYATLSFALAVLTACTPRDVEPVADVFVSTVFPAVAAAGEGVTLTGRFSDDLTFRVCGVALLAPRFFEPQRVRVTPGSGTSPIRYARVEAIVPDLPPAAECAVLLFRGTEEVGSGRGAVFLGIPPAAPLAPTITRFTPTSTPGTLELDFLPPMDDGGRPVVNHELQIGDGPYLPLDPPRIRGPLSLPGFAPNVDVTVRLRAVNEVGAGPPSAPRTTRSVVAPERPPEPDPDASAGVVNGELVIAVRGVALTIGILDLEGNLIPVRARDPRLLVPRGGRVRIGARGLLPGSDVAVWVYSQPQLIGYGSTEPDGSFAAAFPMPDDLLEQEEHTFVFQATGADGQGVDVGTDTIVVEDDEPQVIEVSIDQGDTLLLLGATQPFTATVIAFGGADATLDWSSSDPQVASVGGDGVVTTLATGQATITAASRLDPERFDTVVVTVVEPPSAPRDVRAASGDGEVTLAWLPPERNGGLPIDAYRVVATPSGASCQTTTLSCSVTGLTNRTPYAFVVMASHALAEGDPSGPIDATPFATPNLATSTLEVVPVLLPPDGASTAAIVVTLRDRDGEEIGVSRGDVTLRLSAAIGTLSAVVDEGMGVYRATFQAGTVAGDALLQAALDGVDFAQGVLLRLLPGIEAGFDVIPPVISRVTYTPSERRLRGTASDAGSGIAWLRVFDGPRLLASSKVAEQGGGIAAISYLPGVDAFEVILPSAGPDARRLEIRVADRAGNEAQHVFVALPFGVSGGFGGLR